VVGAAISPKYRYGSGGLRLAHLRLGELALVLVGFVERVEGGVEQQPHPPGFDGKGLVLGARLACDRPRLGLGLGDDRRRLALGLVLQLVCGPLRRDEGRAQQVLEVAISLQLVLEQLDAVTPTSTRTPTIGDTSSGPSAGRIRRKSRRYGSQTSYRKR